MPLYLTRFSYTPATWAKLIKNPEDRRAAAKEYIEGVGGKLHGFWYAFGDHDGYNLWEAPDNVSMAATALAIGVVDILISGKPSEHRLPQESDQRMTAVLAGARISKHLPRHGAEAEGVVEFAIGQQSRIGGDPRAMELKLHAAVKIEPESTID